MMEVFKKKESSLKLSDYFELRKPVYRYIKITPHKSIRNYSTSSLSKAVSATYKSLSKKIYKEKSKLIIETNFSIKYIIDIYKEDVNFYFIVPNFFLNICIEKISEIWNKATIEVLEEKIKPFNFEKSQIYGLSYKYLDGLSLNVDRKLNEPLNSILRTMEIMKDDDRVTVIYNFMPRTSIGFKEKYEETIKRFKEKKNIQKANIDFDYICYKTLDITIGIVEGVLNVVCDFIGGTGDINIKKDLYLESLLERRMDDLSPATKRKKEVNVIDTQIAVISESDDYIRRSNNIDAVSQAFKSIDGDNELVRTASKEKFSVEDYNIKTKSSTLSTEEASQLLQIPGRSTLMQLGIKHIKTEEVKVPQELQQGKKRLGIAKFKGTFTKAYLEDKYDIASLPLTLLGKMGGGKSTYLANFAKDCSDNGESVVLIDYIKSCGLSEEIKKVVPKEKIIELDLSDFNDLQGFGFDELKVKPKATAFERLEAGNLQTIQLKSFINSIVVGDPLSSRMETILGAAGDIVFSLGYTAIKDVIKCLTCYKTRLKYINELKLDKELFELLDEEVETLQELDEYSKVTGKEAKEGVVPEVIGTRESKIEHILDRTRVLRSDAKLKLMYKKNTEDNIDIVKAMNEGKVILFKMPQAKFPSKHVKNIMVTYLISKIWLACAARGAVEDKPLPCNVLIDEIHQAPQVMEDLIEIIPQTRKFGCKLVFAIHNVDQVKNIANTLESAGASFMFLNGCLESDFNRFKSNLVGFEYEDLREMEQFHALNLVSYSNGYASFITKLPGPIKQEI